MNRKFTAPFRFLLVVGLLYTALEALSISVILRTIHQADYWRFIWLFSIYPSVIFIEVFLYWVIRKKNRNRRASWIHVTLLTIALFSRWVATLVMTVATRIMHYEMPESRWRLYYSVLFGLFWALVVIAHIYFIRVLMKSWSKTPEPEQPPSQNILDDLT